MPGVLFGNQKTDMSSNSKTLKEIETSEGDYFRLIKTLDNDKVWCLYVEGAVNFEVDWLKQEHLSLYNTAITRFPKGILSVKPIVIHDPYDKYGETEILEKEEEICISLFKDTYGNLPKSKKLNIVREIVIDYIV